MRQLVFKLHHSTVAMQSENRTLVTIPAHACVTLLSGDFSAKGIVTISYHNQPLQIFALDLRIRSSLEETAHRHTISA